MDLAPVGDPSAFASAMAAALGFQSQPGMTPREQLVEGLAEWQALLVVDNCEHVADAAGSLIEELLDGSPGLTVLATSRRPLRIGGERVWQVGPLDVNGDAPALFADRAHAARPSFTLDAETEPLVKAICEELDCMPLALELAAARLRSMTAVELLERLGHRFRLLRDDRGTYTSRHATLTAVVEWSYQLLTPDEQGMLCQLGVFVGGFELSAAHAVFFSAPAGDRDELAILDLLDALVDQSLVRAEERDGRTRYSMLETLRQYTAAQWSDEERAALRARHAAYFLAFARAADERLRGAEQVQWFERLETEHHNLRAALAWALGPEGDMATGLGLTAALWWFWRVRSHIDEGLRWYALALAIPPTPETATDRVRALTGAGLLGYFSRSHETANAVLAQARDEASLIGDAAGAGWAQHGLGRVALDMHDYPSASRYFTASIRAFESCEHTRGVAYSTFFAGSVASFSGDAPTAERLFEEAGQTFRALGDVWGLVGVAGVRAWHATMIHDPVGAARHYGEQLSHSAQLDSRWMISLALFGLARTAAVTGRWPLAVELYGSARAVCAAMGAQADKIGGPTASRYLQEAHDALGPEAVEAAWAVGRERTIDEAVAAGEFAAAGLTAAAPRETERVARDGLTTREWEVLRLLAEGRSNKEIADRLVLSVRTVENHLAHVYTKLGVSTRVEATLFALKANK